MTVEITKVERFIEGSEDLFSSNLIKYLLDTKAIAYCMTVKISKIYRLIV